jgi:hypothetical protein
LTGVATTSLAAAWAAIFAVAAAAAVVAVDAVATADPVATADAVAAVDAVMAAAAPESILVCADDAAGAAGAADAGELAAIAAAAIASGAVALPGAGVAAGTSVDAIMTGIATATAFGVIADGPSCFAEAAGTAEESAAEVLSEAGLSVDFSVPAFEALDFALDRWTAAVLAAALAAALESESCLAVASRSSELFRAAWSEDAASRERVLSAVAAASSERRCDADCCCAVEVARSLPVSAAALLSTSAPKRSFPDDGSDLTDLCGGPWKDTFVGASGVTLYTGGLSRWI